jgi:carbamoyl-phosphate synthase large subunit
MKTILFTGGGGASTEALHWLLDHRYVVHFADADPCAKAPWLPVDRWHQVPQALGPYGLVNTAFVPALAELCRELAIDVLVPGVDEELRPIAMRRREFDCYVLLPDFDVVATHLDKLASMRHLGARGIPVPATYRLVPRKGETDWRVPCVLKPREGRGSRDVAIIASQAEGEARVVVSGLPPIDFITQERLTGVEYTVTVVADRSKMLRAIVPVRVDLKRGITLRAITDADQAVIEACRRIHATDPFAGCVNIQLMKASDSDVRPFEINPRISTTTCLAIAAGVDVIALACGDAPGTELAPFTNGLRLHRSWRTEFACAS